MKKILLFGIIAVLILAAVAVMLIQKKEAPPQVKVNAPAVTPIKTPESIQIDWIEGNIQTLPAEANTTEDMLVRQYLYDCSTIDDAQERLACYDTYFENHDEEYVGMKEACGGDIPCLDRVYFDMANRKQDTYCNAIKDPELIEKCRLIG